MRPGYRKCEQDNNFFYGRTWLQFRADWSFLNPLLTSLLLNLRLAQSLTALSKRDQTYSMNFFTDVDLALYRLHRDPGRGLGGLLQSPSAQCVASQSTLSTRNCHFYLYHWYHQYVQQVLLITLTTSSTRTLSFSSPGVRRRSQAVPQKLHQLPDPWMS